MDQARRLLLDSGALIDVEKEPGGETFRSCRNAFDSGLRPLLPTVVFAQVWRGHPHQHAIRRMRGICQPLWFDDKFADTVGRLLARSGTSDVVDAVVAVAAIEHNAAVITSDPHDLAKLADSLDYDLPLITV